MLQNQLAFGIFKASQSLQESQAEQIVGECAIGKHHCGNVTHQDIVDLDHIEIALDTDDEALIALDDALTQLAVEDPEAARLVNLRFFAGLTLRDAAVSLGLSQLTAERQWSYARAWLYARLSQDAGPNAD